VTTTATGSPNGRIGVTRIVSLSSCAPSESLERTHASLAEADQGATEPDFDPDGPAGDCRLVRWSLIRVIGPEGSSSRS